MSIHTIWDKTRLGTVTEMLTDGTHFSPKTSAGRFKYLTSKNVRAGYLDLKNVSFISDEEHRQIYSRCPVRNGDLLLTKDGANTGNAALFNLSEECSLLSSIAVIRGKESILHNGFLLQLILSDWGQKLIRSEMAGQAITRLTLEKISALKIPIPPFEVQKSISTSMSYWDLAIEKAERLIAAKEKRFTLLTQELIHNCTDGLRHFHLRDICEPVTRKNDGNELNVLTTSAQHGLISQLDYYKKSVSAEDVRGYYLLKNGEFAYNRSSSNGYPYGAIKRLEDYPQGVLSTLYLCFSLKNDAPCDSDFMAHAFEAGLLNKQLVGVCQEGARSHGLLNITKTDFFGLKISLPAITAQKQIATLLNTARQEIDLLKKQAEAYRRQKRGLMQKLLTGEWRVRVG